MGIERLWEGCHSGVEVQRWGLKDSGRAAEVVPPRGVTVVHRLCNVAPRRLTRRILNMRAVPSGTVLMSRTTA